MAKINLGKVVPQKGVDYFTEEQKKEFLDESLNQLKDNIADKLTEPAGAQVGQFFRVASINADGHYVLEAVNAPSGGVSDVLVNGASVIVNGVANMPKIDFGAFGVTTTSNSRGLQIVDGALRLQQSDSDNAIRVRRTSGSAYDFQAITTGTLNTAVTAALTDANHITLTADQQKTAQEVLGILSVEGVTY